MVSSSDGEHLMGGRLQIVIPTVPGREEWLDECLASIRAQDPAMQFDVKVSGNGTADWTQEIARKYGSKFIQRPTKLRPERHARAILGETKAEYLWIIGDDDLLAPGALELVSNILPRSVPLPTDPLAIIGRVRYFTAPDYSDLGMPRPDSSYWRPGSYREISTLAKATHGQNHFGAFIFRTRLFSVSDLDKYEGTEHSLFGAFWEGISRARGEVTLVLDDCLVHMRQAEKAWDASRTAVRLGVKKYVRLLPPEISAYLHHLNSHLTCRKSLEMASITAQDEREVLQQLVSHYQTFSIGAKLLARLPQPIARATLFVVDRYQKLLDAIYKSLKGLRSM